MYFSDPETKPQEFSISDVFEATGRVMGQNLFKFSGVYLVFLIPVFVSLTISLSLSDELGVFDMIVAGLLASVTLAVANVYITRWAYGELFWKTPDDLRRSLPRRAVIGRMIWAIILFAFAVLAGLVMLILPGIAIYFLLFFMGPAIVIDDESVWGSVQKSMEVASGYRGIVYLAVFIYGAVFTVVDQILGLIGETFLFFYFAELVWIAAASAYGVVLSLVIYEKLKAAKAAKARAG